jgi:general secretion pathway protein B
MSFILDALKKSESDRQRHSGPALFEVKVAAPRSGLPLWAIALGVLLLANVGVVAWLLLRKPASALPVAVAEPYVQQSVAPVQSVPPPISAPPAQPVPQSTETAPPVSDAAGSEDQLNPDDYEPAVNPNGAAAATPQVNTTRGTEVLPTYAELASSPGSGLPALRLDMHVYSANPQGRFIFLNMQRLHEGGALQDGVRVEQITPEGAILSYRNLKFVLERE